MKRTAIFLILGGIISILVAIISFNVKEFTDDVYLQRDMFCFGCGVVFFMLNLVVWKLARLAYDISNIKLFKVGHYIFGYGSILSLSNLFDELTRKNLEINFSEVLAAFLALIYTIYIILRKNG